MTKREKEIIEILKKEPMISQSDLADRLNISRSSVAVHITNLMKKEIIAGKGYFLREERYVAVVGGANIDLLGSSSVPFRLRDSNPGTVLESAGGVGRNIAENLALLKVPVRFLTTLGDDHYGHLLEERCSSVGIDMTHVEKDVTHPTGMYVSIQDEHGEMITAINQMNIYEDMDSSYLRRVTKVLEAASVVVMDTNFSQEAIDYTMSQLGHKKVFLDTVSTVKAMRVKDHLDKIFVLKPNKEEAQALSGIMITDDKSLRECAQWFINKGVTYVMISMGSEGTFVASRSIRGKVTAKIPKIVGASGAGDAFVAGVVAASLETEDVGQWAVEGTAASYIAMANGATINDSLSPEQIQETIKEYDISWIEL